MVEPRQVVGVPMSVFWQQGLEPRKGTDVGFRFRPDRATPCVGEPEIFFSENAVDMRAAAEACAGCPFMNECRLEGLERSEEGMWGGLSKARRNRMGAPQRQREMLRLRLLLAQKQQQREAS